MVAWTTEVGEGALILGMFQKQSGDRLSYSFIHALIPFISSQTLEMLTCFETRSHYVAQAGL